MTVDEILQDLMDSVTGDGKYKKLPNMTKEQAAASIKELIDEIIEIDPHTNQTFTKHEAEVRENLRAEQRARADKLLGGKDVWN